MPAGDDTLLRARRIWFASNYPQLAQRAHGVALAFGVDPGSSAYEFASLPLAMTLPGCSVGWIPPARSTTKGPLMTRFFDFTTRSFDELLGGQRLPGESALAGLPHVIESYPTDGLPSLVVCAFDLLSGATEGINAVGLTVALLADDKSTDAEPLFGQQVGIGEHEICRFLLDTCRTVDEAVFALRLVKQYYTFVRCHYLIGDASGRSFVWEHTAGFNGEKVVWSDGLQVVTNHLLHHYRTLADLPVVAGNSRTYDRARRLHASLDQQKQVDPDNLASLHACVRIHEAAIPARTLWHTIFDVRARSASISFYLGDEPHGGERRSEYQTFTLDA